MKTIQKNKAGIRRPNRLSRMALAGMMFAASVGICQAVEYTVSSFDTSASASGWSFQNWNGSTGVSSWSSTNDAQSNPSSGSLELQVDFNPTDNGGAFILPVNDLDASAYTALEYDVKVDPASPLDQYGTAADFKVGVQTGSGYVTYNNDLNITVVSTNNGWEHIIVPASSLGNSTWGDVKTVLVQLYDNNYTNDQTPVIYIDNIKFTGPDPTYPDYMALTFDDATTTAAAGTNWYGNPVATEWSTNDADGNPASGSLHVVGGLLAGDNNLVCAIPFDTNYPGVSSPTSDTNIVINGQHYISVEMDVLWDTNLSTVSITNFNSEGDIGGFPLGLLYNAAGGTGDGGQAEAFGGATTSLPDEASNGWVHLSFPLNKTTPGIDQTIGLWLKKYNGNTDPAYNGTVAFYIDNVKFIGGPLEVEQPTATISKPVKGLNIVNNFNAYDRESLETYGIDFSFVDQADPVTYSINIAGFPGVNYAGYNARIYLVPNASAVEAEPDYVEPTMAMISIAINSSGQPYVQIGCKTNSANGNGDLFDGSNPSPSFPSSPVLGNWSFTFTQNTNVLITAPDGSNTNVAFPLGLTPDQVSSYFGSSMVVYFGGYNNGGANLGQRCVLASVGITNGSNALLYDNFLTDTQINYNLINGGPWIEASDGSTPESIYLLSPTTMYYLDWTVPATGFVIQTNSMLNDSSAWATNASLTAAQYGDHFHSEIDETNLPPSGNLFFRLNNSPAQ